MKSIAANHRGSYVFGQFRLSADGTLLVRDGTAMTLAPKVLRTLLALVERAGRVVSKDDLLRSVWPDSFVEETGLSRNISLLRQALGDESQHMIVTVTRVGYRFAAPVVSVDAPVVADSEVSGVYDGRTADLPHAGVDEQPARPGRLLVLPFRLLREDPDTGFLAFSVPDAVVTALSGLQSLVVRSSAVANRLATQPLDLHRIAREANVDALVTGTMVRAGDQVRVNVQLVTVPSGRVLWSESLQVGLGAVFELQDRITTHIVRSLSLSLTLRERKRLRTDVPATSSAYEFFLRANEVMGPQGIVSSANLRVARELYARALDEDPGFAPGWARLGRCHYLIGKADQLASDESRDEHLARADACFQRALTLSPNLILAHSLYALVEIDRGRAQNAMVRLIGQALAGIAAPELYASLVQACRYCGLLEASVAAHYRARALDPNIATSGYQSIWHLGDDEGALREAIRPYLLRAIIAGMRGDTARALEWLHNLDASDPTSLVRCLTGSMRAVFEGRADAAFESARPIFEASPDPESWYFAGRPVAAFGDPRALVQFGRALDGGYVLYRMLLRNDAWLDPLRGSPEFQRLVERSRDVYRERLTAYLEAGGESLLGPVPTPEEVEAAWRCEGAADRRSSVPSSASGRPAVISEGGLP